MTGRERGHKNSQIYAISKKLVTTVNLELKLAIISSSPLQRSSEKRNVCTCRICGSGACLRGI